MRLSWVIPSEAVTKTRQTYFGILETTRVRYITLRAVHAAKLRPRYAIFFALKPRVSEVLVEYYAHSMLGH